MTTLPTNRTTANTSAEHVTDHNEIHRLHDILDGSTKTADAAQAAAIAASQPADADLTAIAALDATVAGVMATDGAGWIRKTYAQLKTALGLVKADVGLGNVDNTSDAAKPVSTAQAASFASEASTARSAESANAASISTETTNRAAADKILPSSVQTANYTTVLGDAGTSVQVNAAGAVVVTIPTNATVAYPVDTVLWVSRVGAGSVTVAAAGGVTIVTAGAISVVGAAFRLHYRGGDVWSCREVAPPGTYALSSAVIASLPATFVSRTTAGTVAVGEFSEVNATAGAVALTLPANPAVGALVAGVKTDSSANAVTWTPSGGGTITGDANASTTTKGGGAIFEHKGGNVWYVAAAMLTTGPAGPTGPAGAAGATGAAYGRPKPSGGVAGYVIPGVTFATTLSTQAMSQNRSAYFPFKVDAAITIDQLMLEVTTAVAATAIRCAIYAANADFQPSGAPLVDSANIDTTTTGIKTVTVSVTLQPGLYVFWLNQSGAGNVVLRDAFSTTLVGLASTGAGNGFPNQMYVAETFAAPSSTPTAWTNINFSPSGFAYVVFARTA